MTGSNAANSNVVPFPSSGVTIPATTDELTSALNGLGALVTAKEWERAAIVWAWTEDVGHGGKRRGGFKVEKYTLNGFAALRVQGLKTFKSVAKYRNAWQWAINKGHATSVEPGETQVRLPDVDWGAWEPDSAPEPAPQASPSAKPAAPVRDSPARPVFTPPVAPTPSRPVVEQHPSPAGRWPCVECGRFYMLERDQTCQQCVTEQTAEAYFAEHGTVTLIPDWDQAVADGKECTGVFHFGRPDIQETVRAFTALADRTPALTAVERHLVRQAIAFMSARLDATEG